MRTTKATKKNYTFCYGKCKIMPRSEERANPSEAPPTMSGKIDRYVRV